uniref:Rootletin-like coiled-coil domain-containing protein n=1 Tax=Piliocolobus tephrosceles TaxID=591936 RepID=A0A8C9GVQ7_9PRIM
LPTRSPGALVSRLTQRAQGAGTAEQLRRQLQEEQASYRRKLQAYQEGQQRQAQLVQRLQGKILQYKKRCSELEQQLLERSRVGAAATEGGCQGGAGPGPALYLALIGLEEEQQRSASLAQVNAMLREQLDQAGSANQALSEDIRKVTSDWARSRKELEQREAAWRREEEVGMGVQGGQLDPRGRCTAEEGGFRILEREREHCPREHVSRSK